MELSRLIKTDGKRMKNSEEEDVEQWSTREVVAWLSTLGLDAYAESFRAHEIRGSVLHLLSDDQLKELGVAKVGHRLVLIREASMLERRAFDRSKYETKWEADAVKHSRGCAHFCWRLLCCCDCCCSDVERYVLTGTHLHLTELEGSRPCLTKRTRSIELDHVASVEVVHREACCDCGCSADTIQISVSGAQPKDLIVLKGHGPAIARRIQETVEEAAHSSAARHNYHPQAGPSSSSLADGTAPAAAAMRRGGSLV